MDISPKVEQASCLFQTAWKAVLFDKLKERNRSLFPTAWKAVLRVFDKSK